MRTFARIGSALRWLLAAVIGLALLVPWALFALKGWSAITGWLLLVSLTPYAGFAALLFPLADLLRRRRPGRLSALLGVLSLAALLPALWLFGVGLITFPAEISEARPTVSVRLPSDEPLRVLWGGDRVAVNYHASTPGQRWAYDLAPEPTITESAVLTDYGCFDTIVVAPIAARVQSTVDGDPDEVPGKLSNKMDRPLGNHVVLALETGTFLVIAHLRPGSVLVKAGEEVAEGQPLGRCGNSGNTSEPHIHIHHQRQNPQHPLLTVVAEGLPLFFRDHDGPPMPEGGFAERDGRSVPIGPIVKHVAGTGGD